jgi:hypothetical protein
MQQEQHDQEQYQVREEKCRRNSRIMNSIRRGMKNAAGTASGEG